MIIVTKDNKKHKVTRGAFESIFKPLGYEIVPNTVKNNVKYETKVDDKVENKIKQNYKRK